MNREKLGSRLGFIMLSAGCAIGCGNVWKFPWLIMESSVGRAAQTSPIKCTANLKSQSKNGAVSVGHALWATLQLWLFTQLFAVG